MRKILLLLSFVPLAFGAAPVVTNLNSAGSASYIAGKYSEAEEYFSQALQLENNPAALATISANLAAVYRSQARYPQAESLYRSAIAMRQDLFGPDHPSLGGALAGLGLVCATQGKLTEADSLARRALKTIAGRASIDAAGITRDVALIFFHEGRYEEATVLIDQILSQLSDSSQEGAASYAEALTLRGLLERTRGRLPQARDAYQRAAEILERTSGSLHPSTIAAWNNLGQVEAAEGNWAGAIAQFQRAITAWQKVYGKEHPALATGYTNLAAVYVEQKRYDDAETLFQHALAIDSKATGEASPKAALDLNNLGSLAFRRRRLGEAEGYLARALAADEKTLGPQHPETGAIAGNLAAVLIKRRRFQEAEPLLRLAVEGRDRAAGPAAGKVNQDFGELLKSYAVLLRMNQNFSEAAKVDARVAGRAYREARDAQSRAN